MYGFIDENMPCPSDKGEPVSKNGDEAWPWKESMSVSNDRDVTLSRDWDLPVLNEGDLPGADITDILHVGPICSRFQ